MNALVIDDERLAREALKQQLASFPSITVVGEAANATEAAALIAQLKPDLVFLDIEMPGRNAFEFLASLPVPQPRVIFVTAYDAFALRAFEVNALDYLLKPVVPERLAAAIEKAAHATSPYFERSIDDEIGADDQACFEENDSVFVKDGERYWYIAVKDIRLVEQSGNYSRLFVNDESVVICRTLSALESRLPRAIFFRANRAQLINCRHIAGIRSWFSGSLAVTLKGGTEVELSRRQSQLLRQKLSL